MSRALLAAAFFASALAGCSAPPLPNDFAQAYAREAAQDDPGALAIYRQIIAGCEKPGARPRGHDECALAIEREAEVLEELRRWPDAYRAWLEVPRRATDDSRAARALERAAELAHERLSDDAGAARIAWRAATRYPDAVAAGDALKLAVKLEEPRDPAALARRLETLWPEVARRDLGDDVLFQAGELYRRHGDAPSAVRIYDLLAAKYPRSGLRDDAIWNAAHLLRPTDPKGALRHLQIILDSRRDALITGSYNSVYLDDAELLVGQIWRDDLHQLSPAIDAFSALAFDFPESTLKDDALVELARTFLLRHQPPDDQDRADACKALTHLLTTYPDSNRRREAGALSTELSCK
ncbi:MAG TPA: tetratricopeptide repeat protein [Polyangia bacterium]